MVLDLPLNLEFCHGTEMQYSTVTVSMFYNSKSTKLKYTFYHIRKRKHLELTVCSTKYYYYFYNVCFQPDTILRSESAAENTL